MTALEVQASEAKKASRVLMTAGSALKDRALSAIADAITERADEWLDANALDMEAADRNGISEALKDRLRLDRERVMKIADSVRDCIALPDPLAVSDETVTRPNGIVIQKRRVPLGVIGIIYEARPNVTVDAAVLCLKSGNVCILRGGKEAISSNRAVTRIMRDAIRSAGLPEACVSLVQDTARTSATELMHLDRYIDVLIPRGGAGLIRTVAKESSVPVIRTGEGICHIYIDKAADLDMGASVLFNGKCSRPSVCNAVECVLVHKDVMDGFLEKAIPLMMEKKVQFRCDEESIGTVRRICQGGYAESGLVIKASPEDWDTEYDDYKLAVRTVSDYDEAVDFINEHGTMHSEAIITSDYITAQHFLNDIDAAAVYVNASTRFTDGGEFGLGAEIGISTQKLHARGPMGLKELTSIKYAIYGEGQIR